MIETSRISLMKRALPLLIWSTTCGGTKHVQSLVSCRLRVGLRQRLRCAANLTVGYLGSLTEFLLERIGWVGVGSCSAYLSIRYLNMFSFRAKSRAHFQNVDYFCSKFLQTTLPLLAMTTIWDFLQFQQECVKNSAKML